MKHSIALLALVLLVLNAWAVPQWHRGSVVLASKEVLVGNIALELRHDLILFKSDSNRVSILPAHRLSGVFIYDHQQDINRKFTVIQQEEAGAIFSRLYEAIVLGEISVLRKPITFGSEDNHIHYNYFLYTEFQLIPVNKFRDHLLKNLLFCCKSLHAHMRKENLDPNVSSDVIQIILYYNRATTTKFIARNS